MAAEFKQEFQEGVSLDLSESKMKQTQAALIKNMTANVNANPNSSSGAGFNMGKYTPLEGNTLLPITLPAGTNYCVGFYSSQQTNEGYAAIYNSNAQHTILVIRGDTGAVQIVYQGARLPFILDPKYFLSEGCWTLELRSYTDKATGLQTDFKFLIFSNDRVQQFYLSVEDSIATNSYSTAYFTATGSFYDPLELIHLGVPTPLKCIGINSPNPYVPVPEDLTKQNLIVRKGTQVRIKTIDIFGRESEHGIISIVFTPIKGAGCITASNGIARCFNMCFDAGNPLVDKFIIEFREWIGNERSGSIATNWNEYEVFNKYDNSATVKWYARGYNPLFTTAGSGVTFDLASNTITYTYCADKNSVPVNPDDTARTEPGIPLLSKGIFPVNKRIGLYNNLRGFDPIAPSMIDKVVFSAQLPDPASVPCPAAPLRKIVFYANICNPYQDAAGLFASSLIRSSYTSVVFGNSDNGKDCQPGDNSYTSSFALGQKFGDQTNPGFIAFLAGTPYKCISVQGDYEFGTKKFTPVGYGAGIGSSFPNSIMQRFEIVDVPAGVYVARIASHRATINDGDLQQTSTYVAGIVPIDDLTIPRQRIIDAVQFPDKEIRIDCSTGDVVLDNGSDFMFLIYDLGNGVSSGAIDGYLYEEPSSVPVEMAPVYIYGDTIGSIGDAFGSHYTDHNGFFFTTSGSRHPHVKIFADFCDGAGIQERVKLDGNPASIQHGYGNDTPAEHCHGDSGYWKNRVYLSSAFPDTGRRTIVQQITTCDDHNIGVPGVPVIMTRGQAAQTDTSGTVRLIAHNRYTYATSIGGNPLPYLASYLPNFGTSPKNKDAIFFSQKGGCQWTACGGCVTYTADVEFDYVGCGGSRVTTLADVYVQPSGIGISGVQSGGKYPVAFVLHDIIGRHTAAQVRQGEAGFVNIPNINDVDYPTVGAGGAFALCKIAVNIGAGFAVDPKYKKMTLCVAGNSRFTDYISLTADWVTKIDNTGAENNTNPTAMRFYYGSLNEYNKTFDTNTNWQFLTNKSNNDQEQADIVQFITDGTGNFLPSVISAPVTYDRNGLFFTIDYLPELANVTNGALFRVIRPRKNQSAQSVPFYEQCLTIDLVNGVPTATSFVLPYEDSYLLSRVVPVPILKGQPGPIPPGATPKAPILYTSSNEDAKLNKDGYATNNVNNNNAVVRFELTNYPTSYPVYYESPSPSDFYCSHMASLGRVMFANPSERARRIGTEVALCDEASDRGELNFLSYFRGVNAVVFDRNAWGNITSILSETSQVLVICETDHFVATYNSSNLRIGANNTVEAENQYGIFSAPQRKSGINYGCNSMDKNTIRQYGGIVRWLDRAGYVVFHNFASAKSVEVMGYEGYINNKISKLNILNQNPGANGITYWSAGIDPKGNYFLGTFNIPASGASSYINSLSEIDLSANETLVIDSETGVLKAMASFTPEYYGNIPGYYVQKNLLSFKNGKPYIHYNGVAGASLPFNNFYGVQCKKLVVAVVNIGGEKIKRFLYNEVYCQQHMFVALTIKTDRGQLSRLLKEQWDKREKFYAAAFLCDLNTPVDPNLPLQTGANVILDGNPLAGEWMKVYYSSLDADDPLYCELHAIVNYVIGIDPSA